MLNPPIVENKTAAQTDNSKISISFLMNRSVGMADFDTIHLLLKSVQSNTTLLQVSCPKESLVLKNGSYQANFEIKSSADRSIFKIGQYYKAQIAYGLGNDVGFYSNVTTFKFTSKPSVSIEKLKVDEINTHFYDYTGVYENSDTSEKVYSYEFSLYDNSNNLVATSGELLHNSSLDTDIRISIDKWTTRYGLDQNKTYFIIYKVKTVNGIEFSSPAYSIVDAWTVPSTLFQYCDFVATNISDSACVELSLQPKKLNDPDSYKFISGQFILLRSSNEDNFTSWYELTRFTLSSHDTGEKKSICKDYCVSQGVQYKYALQAYNNTGLHSLREETRPLLVDFEDMFLSDGKRQLKIRFNPKVSSFKTTILESKIDTLGGKYPFFFRNGNVGYKEFPISGLISMLMDESEEFMQGIQVDQQLRSSTPASNFTTVPDLSNTLSGDNFRREREFKLEVLNWLTNGEPKYFRSPAEGSFIVRLMNTSLSPNDTLGRMLHSFSCTAYEIADHTFENLRKYGIMMKESLESRDLKFYHADLSNLIAITDIVATLATLHTTADTEFLYQLKNDNSTHYTKAFVGKTGIYIFPSEVLAENPLIAIKTVDGEKWPLQTKLTYAQYVNREIESFSYLHSVNSIDRIEQWIGNNEPEIPNHLDPKQILKSIGQIYYLNISKRHIRKDITEVVWNSTKREYEFFIAKNEYKSGFNELIYFENNYYDGKTKQKINTQLNFTCQLRENEPFIDFSGTTININGAGTIKDCESIADVGGRLILTNIKNIDHLFIGNGLFVDIAYQELNKTYTVEVTENHPVKIAKDKWEQTQSGIDYQDYYNLLANFVKEQEGDLIIDAI